MVDVCEVVKMLTMTRFDDRVETVGTVDQARSRGAVYTVPHAQCISVLS